MNMGARAICPCQPPVADGYFRQHYRLVAVVALRAGAVVARSLDVSSVQWASDGTQVVSVVLTAMTFSNTSARTSAMENLTAILITMRCVWMWMLTIRNRGPLTFLNMTFLALRTSVLSLQDGHRGRALHHAG
jgi:hypothetical protein